MFTNEEQLEAPTLFSKVMRFWVQQKLLVFSMAYSVLKEGTVST